MTVIAKPGDAVDKSPRQTDARTNPVFKTLDEKTLVAGQITPADIAKAKALGVTTVINNRPDGEAPDQPRGADIAAAASAEGLEYVAIPVSSGFSMEQVMSMRDALADAKGPVLAFCRSGTRSTNLWSLARAMMGDTPESLSQKAAAQGYDLSPLMGALNQLSAQGR